MTTHRRLREATRIDHEAVDSAFARFDLSDRASYAAFLRAHAGAIGAVEPAIAPERPRLPLLAADLAALDEALPPPLPFTPPDAEAEGARWGVRYTLEGSRLGGAMLARTVAPGLPIAYLSARHAQGEWRRFTDALDRAIGREDELAAAVAAARVVFGLFAAGARQETSEMHAVD